eukprot:TRINITY_DN51826_c0_g1_i1.p1 TRINITY_DN51826_c0_g1~~TRINITY_DN51826_c0_g1_i1.p1  ORF type:complete len:344 (+),score=35.34 TRINITY_DN51826_c0_g1_i1:63-1034(+)
MAKVRVFTVRLLAFVALFPSIQQALGLRRNLKGSPLSSEAESNDYTMFMPPHENAMLNTKLTGAHFLRIQKTGGTTFGEHIMRKFCGPESDICKWASHLDWSSAKEGWNGPVVTLIRDPVERTMSEYSFIRSKDGNYSCRQAQWDFRNFTWFNAVASEPDEDVALNLYLRGYQDSPSRNRQALYLNGFKKLVNGAPVPEYTYDWDIDHDSTLAQAKDHLDQVTVFGITDCFLPSMHVIARELDWAEDDVVAMATSTHSRVASRRSLLSGRSTTTKRQRWRDTIDPSVVDRIERANRVDMELYKYALQSLYERFGVDCANALSA